MTARPLTGTSAAPATEVAAVAAEPHRLDGWIATYLVEVVFDTNEARTGYDNVGTVARCTCCGGRLDLRSSPAVLARHARQHEAHLSVGGATGHPVERDDHQAATFDGPRTRMPVIRRHASLVSHRKEVTTEHTTD